MRWSSPSPQDRGLSSCLKPNRQDPHDAPANPKPDALVASTNVKIIPCRRTYHLQCQSSASISAGEQKVRELEHPARPPDRPGQPDPRSTRDLQQWVVNRFQQGPTIDLHQQKCDHCEKQFLCVSAPLTPRDNLIVWNLQRANSWYIPMSPRKASSSVTKTARPSVSQTYEKPSTLRTRAAGGAYWEAHGQSNIMLD